MAPRTAGARIADSLIASTNHGPKPLALGHEMFPEVAVKCDLCRNYEAPACVQSCPTEALVRLEPTQDFADVADLLGTGSGPNAGRRRGVAAKQIAVAVALLLSSSLGVLGWGLHAKGVLVPGRGLGYAAGWLSMLLMLLLVAYALPKRVVRLWMRRRKRSPTDHLLGETSQMGKVGRARSVVRPFYVLHVAIGIVVVGTIAAHAGLRMSASSGGALSLALWLTVGLGLFGAVAYDLLPRRLSRIERSGALPEDLGTEHRHLTDRLYRSLSGRSDLVKTIAGQILIPYAHSPIGSVALLLSGRGLKHEERRIRSKVDDALQGRGVGKLAGLDDVVRIAVEMRALPLRRILTFGLRSWLPIHLVATGITIALLFLHVIVVLWNPTS